MYLAQIKLKNFRGIKSCEFYLLPHCVLLGANNSGKSTLMDAIGYLLGRDRMIRSLGDYDFFGGKPQPQDRIHISGVVTGFPTNDPTQYPEWFNTMNGGTPIWFNPETNDLMYGDYKDNYNLSVQIAFCARFDDEELEYEHVRYFIDADTDPFEDSVVKVSPYHLKEIGFFLVPSKRNWERTISFGSDLFKKVIKFQNAIPGKTVCKTRDTLRAIEDRIENEEPLKTIVDRINIELAGFINSKNNGLNFIPTTGDIEGVLQSLTPHLSGNGETNIPLGNHGSGLVSMQTLLLLLEFGRHRNENGSNFILGTEEPELHLQPGLHRRLVARIRGLSNQSIITTHSPQIASYYRPNEINILRNSDGQLKIVPLLKSGESLPTKNALIRLYTIHRADICEALMNKRVILPEGITEYFWIKALMSALVTAEGWELFKEENNSSMNIGILPTQDSHVEVTFKAFHHLIDELLPFVDGDNAGDEYVKKLVQLSLPPSVILQLPTNWDLERVLTWVISIDEDSIPEGLLKSIENEPPSNTSLLFLLKSHKTKWDAHERIIEYIATTEHCVKRAKQFIYSLNHFDLLDLSKNQHWLVDASRSTTATKVVVFKPQ